MIEVNKIYNENCLETMSRMPDDFIDLVVTSPPYDELRDYNGYSFDFEKIAGELFRIIKPGGVIVWIVNDGTVDGSETCTSFKQAIYFKEIGLRLHDTMIWDKTSSQFPGNTRYHQVFEYMMIFSKGVPKTINLIKDKLNKDVRKNKMSGHRKKNGELNRYRKSHGETTYRNNVWQINQGFMVNSKDEVSYKHPATFPERLAGDHIVSWSNENDLVYDCFGGSGTVAKMAHELNRNWILSEISSEYVELAKKRIDPYLRQTKLFNVR